MPKRSNDGLTWETPPPRSANPGGRTQHPCWAAMKTKPNQWARLPLAASGVGLLRITHPEFELIVRTIDGEPTVFGRYIGNGPKS